ncbi:MAG: peptide transporter [Myxococcales bacterium]|nr:peptide transporter [Myxococcales bacterium]
MKNSWLPKVDTWQYYVLLAGVTGVLLGPLGGLAAMYMNFSLGFFVGGQVLVGILGSVITFHYGAQGRHGANYMQTMAGVLSSMCGMAVLVQAMYWLGMTPPPAWQMAVFFIAVGMFGIGLGVIYTPLLVDRLKLTYPSGAAVATIIRALTDPKLLKVSIMKLGGGILAGAGGGVLTGTSIPMGGFSSSTLGAGMIVSQRIAIPGLVMGLIGYAMTPTLKAWGWIGATDPFRKIGFLIALAMILGASLVDLTLIFWEAIQRIRGAMKEKPEETPANQQVNFKIFIGWAIFWGVIVTVLAKTMLHQPIGFILLALGLVLLFLLVNGISTGISDSNPISSAFVLSVLLMSVLGLKDPVLGLFAASILLICCSVGVDMQQALATGRRLGTSRMIQFHFQWGGVIIGAIFSMMLAGVFFKAYPDLTLNAVHQEVPKWQSAMTYKIVGILEDIGNLKPHQMYALIIGLVYGVAVQILRKLLKDSARYREFLARAKQSGSAAERWRGIIADFCIDALLLSSPYAFSFGGFVDVPTVLWFAVGGVICSSINFYSQQKVKPGEEMPEEIGTTFLVGGGLIAGDAIYALAIGLVGLFGLLLG